MKLKGFKKLSLQIGVLSLSMMALSFLTDTEIWLEYFNYYHNIERCLHGFGVKYGEHYHWNYRGWVYFLTGLIYFGITSAKIITSHKEGDFKN